MTRRRLIGTGAALGASLYLPSWSWAGRSPWRESAAQTPPWKVWDDEADPVIAGSSSAAGCRRSTRRCATGRRTLSLCPRACRLSARVHRARATAAALGRHRQAQGGGRVQQEARHLPGYRLRIRQRHDEHGHPARGARRLLLQGRRQHEAPHLPHGEVRLRHRLPGRLPRSQRRDDRHRGQDPHGARRRFATCCRSRSIGSRSPTRAGRSASATSSSPGTACPRP